MDALLRAGEAWGGAASYSNLVWLGATMANRGVLGGVNRAVAVVLAFVWLSAGIAGIVLGVAHDRWMLVAVAVLAIGYAGQWFRVVARSRLLTWRELVAPWLTE